MNIRMCIQLRTNFYFHARYYAAERRKFIKITILSQLFSLNQNLKSEKAKYEHTHVYITAGGGRGDQLLM
jgi:hypothetical protein